jgi:membrane peptidoglycan carboxypeptidase
MGGHRKSTGGKGGGFRRFVRGIVLLGVAGFVLGVATVAVAYVVIDVPDPHEAWQAETTSIYYADGKHKLGTFELQNRTAVPLSAVPDNVQEAFVAAENREFWTDMGIDPTGILRAAYSNLMGGATQGASTITQQYVKLLYLSQEQTYSRKFQEIILALKVEQEMSKEQILQGYLNTIYFGRGAYGIQAASQAYFGHPAKKLTVREGAVLASVLNSPGTLDPAYGKDNRAALKARYEYVLDGMVETGALSGAQADRLARRLPDFAKDKVTNSLGGPKGHLIETVEEALVAQNFTEDEIYGGGLRVVTTFSYQMQKATQRAVREIAPKGLKQLRVGMASVQPRTGALRAMYGGPDFVQNQLNWAKLGSQPGSSFKPYALAAGLRSGFNLQTYFDGNSPLPLPGGGQVQNQGFTDYGPVTLREATTKSINTAYVDMTLQMENGPENVIEAAKDAGVEEDPDDPLQPVGGVALGAYNIPVTEMAEGYATFAANGRQADWYVLEKVTDDDGSVRYRHQEDTERAFSPAVASNVTEALQTVVDVPAGTGHDAVSDLGRPAAGKTGTATGGTAGSTVSSSWFVGYTPQLSTAVMYARGDGNDPLNGYLEPFYGGDYPAETWTAMMTEALENKPVRTFPEAPRLEEEQESTVAPPPTPTYTYTPDPVYTPSPETSEEPEPTPTESEEPTPTESEEPTPTETEEEPQPSEEPSEEPSDEPTCGLLDPNCGSSTDGDAGGPSAEESTPPGQREWRRRRE